MNLTRPRWADNPAVTLPCQEPGVDPDLFHPRESGETAKKAIALAATFCNRCPERDACLEFGLTSGEWGIWGGRKLDGLGVPGRRKLLADVRKRRGAA